MSQLEGRSRLANTKYKLRKMLKAFIGWICHFMALHSTNHILISYWQLLFKCYSSWSHRACSSQKVSRHSIPPFLAHAVSLPVCCFPGSVLFSLNFSECPILCEGQLDPLTAAICSVYTALITLHTVTRLWLPCLLCFLTSVTRTGFIIGSSPSKHLCWMNKQSPENLNWAVYGANLTPDHYSQG